MSRRNLLATGDLVIRTAGEPLPASHRFGYEPTFLSVGQPWHYEFPYQGSSAVPELRPRFTMPVPGYESTPFPAPPPDDPAALSDKSE